MKSLLKSLKVKHRLIIGFSALVLLLAASVGTTIFEVNTIKHDTDHMVDLLIPTSQSSAQQVTDIQESLAALRGYMITGNHAFAKERAAVWNNAHELTTQINELSTHWSNPEDVAKWNEFKVVLDEFEIAQQKVEDISHTIDETPATKIMTEEAAPRAEAMVAAVTAMIDDEMGMEQSGLERKQLLGMMADTRGSLGLGLSNIRGFLLTGDEKYKTAFNTLWERNEARFAELNKNTYLLSPSQKKSFDEYKVNHDEFAPLPAKMFKIRTSKKWNMANYILTTEATPKAEKLLQIMLGDFDENHERHGGLMDHQKELLAKDADHSAHAASSLLVMQWSLLAIGIFAGTGIAILSANAISKPLVEMTNAMTVLATGDTSAEVPALDRNDEIGAMAAAVQIFKDNRIESVKNEAEREKAQEVQQRRVETLDKLTTDFDTRVSEMINALSAASTELDATAQSMASIAEETTAQTSSMASASQSTVQNIQTVASATEEMTASISELGAQINSASQATNSAVQDVDKASAQIEGLSAAAEEIGNVINMIQDIAEQTNLLALNATIESARAGDAGKGFAVVANEVKSLAGQTAQATEQIAQQIQGIQAETRGAVTAIKDIEGKIRSVNETASSIAAAIEEQNTSTQEISRNTQVSATNMQELDSNVGNVTEAANSTGSAAEQVLSASRDLSQQTDNLKTQIASFLDDVKAA